MPLLQPAWLRMGITSRTKLTGGASTLATFTGNSVLMPFTVTLIVAGPTEFGKM